MASLGDIVVHLGIDVSNFETGLSTAEKRLSTTLGKMEAAGTKMSSVGKTMMMGLSMPIAGAVAGFVKASTDINSEIANIGTLIPGQVERLAELKTAIQDLSIEYNKSTTDMAQGTYQIISALGDTDETVAYLEIAAEAAKAGGAETVDAINLMSANMKGFNDISQESAQNAMDLAFMTVKLGQTTFPELASSMQRIIPVASALNVEQEELYAGYATLTGVTGNTLMVTTQMLGIMRAMMKPTGEMTDAIDLLGYSTADAMLQELGLVGALQALVGTTDGTKEAVAELFPQAEALAAVFALNSTMAETYDSKLAQIRDSSGATHEAFLEVSEGANEVGYKLGQAKQQIIVLAQKMGDALAPAIMEILEMFEGAIPKIEGFVDAFANMDPGMQKFIVGTGLSVAALGPLLYVGGKVVTMFAKLGGGIDKLIVKLVRFGMEAGSVSGAISAIATSIGGMVTAVSTYVGIPALVGMSAYAVYDLYKTKQTRDMSQVEYNPYGYLTEEPTESWYDMTGYDNFYGSNLSMDYYANELKAKQAEQKAQSAGLLDTLLNPSDMLYNMMSFSQRSELGWTSPFEDIVTAFHDDIEEALDAVTSIKRVIELDADISAIEQSLDDLASATGESMGELTNSFFSQLTEMERKAVEVEYVDNEGNTGTMDVEVGPNFSELYKATTTWGRENQKEFVEAVLSDEALAELGFSQEQIDRFADVKEGIAEQIDINGKILTASENTYSVLSELWDTSNMTDEQLQLAKDYITSIYEQANDYQTSAEGLLSQMNEKANTRDSLLAQIASNTSDLAIEIMNVYNQYMGGGSTGGGYTTGSEAGADVNSGVANITAGWTPGESTDEKYQRMYESGFFSDEEVASTTTPSSSGSGTSSGSSTQSKYESMYESGFFGFADGGIVTRPLHALVGEAGPEAIIPMNGQAQSEISNHLLQGIINVIRDKEFIVPTFPIEGKKGGMTITRIPVSLNDGWYSNSKGRRRF